MLHGHRARIIWFTGFSGSGKSTLARALEERLHARRVRTFILDGDNVRHGLCCDLGFSVADREENIRRVGEVARLFLEAGTVVLAAFISPLKADRDRVRSLVSPGDFIEIYCASSLAVCEARDTKGLYRRARAGDVPEFTGVSSPYEAPDAAELVLDTELRSVDDCVSSIMALLEARGALMPPCSGLKK